MIEYVRNKPKEKQGQKENLSPRQTFYMRKVRWGIRYNEESEEKGTCIIEEI